MNKMPCRYLLRSLLLICALISAQTGIANSHCVASTAGNNSHTTIDTILVAQGTYYLEYMTGNGATNRDRALTFSWSSLVVTGGYPTGGVWV